MNKTLGIISARGGSKGILRKNIKLLADKLKLLIVWTIEAALDSHGLDRAIVSTEDEQIAKVSREWGTEVLFLRPASLAEDNSPTTAVVLHALDHMELRENFCADYIHPEGTYGYVMPEENSIDINNPGDFHLADLILRDRLV